MLTGASLHSSTIYMKSVINFILRTYMPGKYLLPRDVLYPFYETVARATGAPIELVIAHAQQESQQNYLAVGQAGEYGLWQFLPSTWISVVGGLDWRSVTNQSIAYIKHTQAIVKGYRLNLQDEGDQKKYLWIWNAGGGNYQKRYMPASTKLYIANILRYKRLVWL